MIDRRVCGGYRARTRDFNVCLYGEEARCVSGRLLVERENFSEILSQTIDIWQTKKYTVSSRRC